MVDFTCREQEQKADGWVATQTYLDELSRRLTSMSGSYQYTPSFPETAASRCNFIPTSQGEVANLSHTHSNKHPGGEKQKMQGDDTHKTSSALWGSQTAG